MIRWTPFPTMHAPLLTVHLYVGTRRTGTLFAEADR